MPLQFTPFVGILAGVVATFIILILTIIIIIKIKYKYGKTVQNTSSNSETEASHYKSFKFDSEKNQSGAADHSLGSVSSETNSPVSGLSDEGSRCSSSEAGDPVRTYPPHHHQHHPGDHRGVKTGQTRLSVTACDNVHSWTPFLSRNCEESVI